MDFGAENWDESGEGALEDALLSDKKEKPKDKAQDISQLWNVKAGAIKESKDGKSASLEFELGGPTQGKDDKKDDRFKNLYASKDDVKVDIYGAMKPDQKDSNSSVYGSINLHQGNKDDNLGHDLQANDLVYKNVGASQSGLNAGFSIEAQTGGPAVGGLYAAQSKGAGCGGCYSSCKH